jgi:hypothetical protein
MVVETAPRLRADTAELLALDAGGHAPRAPSFRCADLATTYSAHVDERRNSRASTDNDAASTPFLGVPQHSWPWGPLAALDGC